MYKLILNDMIAEDQLTHWGRDEMNNISQTTFSNAFSSVKRFEFRLKFHWRLVLREPIILYVQANPEWYDCRASVNTLWPTRYEQHFADDIFKRIFLNENVWISIEISLMFVPKGPINNIPALVQIMAWRRSGDKPLSEPMMVSLPTHIWVTRPQWANLGPGNSLVPFGNKPLPEPVLTSISDRCSLLLARKGSVMVHWLCFYDGI